MMSEPNRVCIMSGPDGERVVTKLTFPVCHWTPEDEPLHLTVHETENGRPVSEPIARSVCNHSEIVNGKAVFKFTELLIMKDEPYGFSFFTDADELAIFNDKGEPIPIVNKNAAVLQSSDYWADEKHEDLVFTVSMPKE